MAARKLVAVPSDELRKGERVFTKDLRDPKRYPVEDTVQDAQGERFVKVQGAWWPETDFARER